MASCSEHQTEMLEKKKRPKPSTRIDNKKTVNTLSRERYRYRINMGNNPQKYRTGNGKS